MKTKLTLIALLMTVVGCQSEVDKCANALMKDKKDLGEGAARLYCLEAQAGKK